MINVSVLLYKYILKPKDDNCLLLFMNPWVEPNYDNVAVYFFIEACVLCIVDPVLQAEKWKVDLCFLNLVDFVPWNARYRLA